MTLFIGKRFSIHRHLSAHASKCTYTYSLIHSIVLSVDRLKISFCLLILFCFDSHAFSIPFCCGDYSFLNTTTPLHFTPYQTLSLSNVINLWLIVVFARSAKQHSREKINDIQNTYLNKQRTTTMTTKRLEQTNAHSIHLIRHSHLLLLPYCTFFLENE